MNLFLLLLLVIVDFLLHSFHMWEAFRNSSIQSHAIMRFHINPSSVGHETKEMKKQFSGYNLGYLILSFFKEVLACFRL